MDERTPRSPVGDHPRGGEAREWEVLVREEASAPMRHAGSVTAPTAAAARDRAARLFAPTASDLWLCPADEVRRFSTRALDDGPRPDAPAGGTTPGSDAGAGGAPDDA
ncbi:MAG: Htur_1727 family rSAM-partnered candidate RiPP [Haloferacaceae archaeon]